MRKRIYEITDKEMIALIKTGNVKHRRCDVCGCELAMPDAGVYIREGLNATACTRCSNTMQHHDLVTYIEDLKKSYSKQEILNILDKRMKDTWGDDASVFTIEEWEEQTKGDDRNAKEKNRRKNHCQGIVWNLGRVSN